MIKHLLDIVGSGLGLVLLSPALLVIALIIKLTSPGPVFFRQERVGLHGRIFRIFKFRSMTSEPTGTGVLVTAGDDVRITPFGAFLRRHKLDELPQLINVLKGDMSLVGPRPEVEQFVKAFPAEYAEILTVKPGITHQGTLMFRNEEEILAGATDPVRMYLEDVMPRKLDIYREYLRQSVWTDLSIVMTTVFPQGAGDYVYRSGRLQAPNVVPMPAGTAKSRPVEDPAMEELA